MCVILKMLETEYRGDESLNIKERRRTKREGRGKEDGVSNVS